MRIAVVGATGATGRQFTQQALGRDHHLTALVRTPSKLDIQDPRLTTVIGDARDRDDMHRVVAGQDAVFCALGGGEQTGKTTIRQDGTRQVITALSAGGETPHLVVVSSLGVGESKQQMGWFGRWIVTWILRYPLADHTEQERLVRESTLPWTILRPTGLTNEPATGNLHVTHPPDRIQTQPGVSRADVAAFALALIEKGDYIGQAVTLTTE
jgi:uncharacterized protein YbjT (DUF2867 family)